MTYLTHRCEESLQAKASIRKYSAKEKWNEWKADKWLLGYAEWDGEWGRTYLHELIVPLRFCPFCGKELDSKENLVGEPCYKLYADRPTYRNMLVRWHHMIDSTDYLYYIIKLESKGEAKLLIEERQFTKTDTGKLNRFTFLTRADAERFLAETRERILE